MELSPEQREKIYREEKAIREGSKGSGISLVLVAAAAVAGFVGFLLLIQQPGRDVKMEDLRRAYEGLSPEEE